jgi:cobalt/nickel transport system permease protein
MHMPNELLSVPVASGCFAISAVCVGLVCKRAEKKLSQEKIPLMGILGAFIFACQMINFPLPFPPGASGHLTGAVFLAIVLGPWAGAVVMTSVVIVQCLIFQDGGLLALGGNIINLALIPSFLGFGVYRLIAGSPDKKIRFYLAAIIASVVAMVAAAAMLSIEAGLSGVSEVPFATFLGAMCGIHLIIGVLEGIITAALLVYLCKVRPDIIDGSEVAGRGDKKIFFATIIAATLLTAACFSLLASEKPDGLEYAMGHREPASTVIESDTPTIETEDTDSSSGWSSFMAVVGSVVTMLAVLVWMKLIRRKETCKCTML